MQKCVIVWLKRDLRTQDHAAFQAACESGHQVLPLFCFEPSSSYCYDFDIRHWRFQWQGLLDLQEKLATYQGQVLWGHSEVLDALEAIHKKFTIESLYSHQETGTLQTFERDKRVKNWCQERKIAWLEFKQLPIQRGSENQAKGWRNGSDKEDEGVY